MNLKSWCFLWKCGLVALLGAILMTACGPAPVKRQKVAKKTCAQCHPVLCKGYDEHGFVFYTNLGSTKADQLKVNPSTSLLFPWLKLERQVIVNGSAEKLSTAEVAKYFVTRPIDSQIAAWASEQSRFTTRQLLRKKFAELREQFASGHVPVPEFWGGFRVRPQTIEFWQGRPSRMHDRLLYTQGKDGAWSIGRLSP